MQHIRGVLKNDMRLSLTGSENRIERKRDRVELAGFVAALGLWQGAFDGGPGIVAADNAVPDVNRDTAFKIFSESPFADPSHTAETTHLVGCVRESHFDFHPGLKARIKLQPHSVPAHVKGGRRTNFSGLRNAQHDAFFGFKTLFQTAVADWIDDVEPR